MLCPLTSYKEEFVKETDIAPKRHLAFVVNLFLQWKAVNQYPHRAVILGSGASRSRASSFFAFTMLFRIRVISRRV